MATRFDIERAVMRAALTATCRHLMHVLCTRIDARAGVILPDYQPSLTDLCRDSWLDRRTIMRCLNVLERGGWVTRDRPPVYLARTQHKRTAYALHIPEGYPQAKDIWRLTAKGRKLRDLGESDTAARGPAHPRSSGSSSSSSGPEIEAIKTAIRKRAEVDVSDEWARRVAEQILGGRDIRNPAAYARRVILGAPVDTYVPHVLPPPAPRSRPKQHITAKGEA